MKKNTKKTNAWEKYADEILEACAPGNMSKQEALEFLEEISANLDRRIETLREELEKYD